MSNVPKDLKDLEYYPRQDSRHLYATPFGRKLWEFMKRPDNVKLMEGASSQGRPAIEPLGQGLLDEFDERDFSSHGHKLMIGEMVSQIMAQLGYRFVAKVSLLRGPVASLFTTASRYRKP